MALSELAEIPFELNSLSLLHIFKASFGCFFTFLTVSSISITVLYGIANSMISIIYGYILGNVAFTFWPYYSES